MLPVDVICDVASTEPHHSRRKTVSFQKSAASITADLTLL